MILSLQTAEPYLLDREVWAIQSPALGLPKDQEQKLAQVLEQALLQNHVECVVHSPRGFYSAALMKAIIRAQIEAYYIVQAQCPVPIPGHQIVAPNPNFWDLELELLLLSASHYVGEAHKEVSELGYPAQALWGL